MGRRRCAPGVPDGERSRGVPFGTADASSEGSALEGDRRIRKRRFRERTRYERRESDRIYRPQCARKALEPSRDFRRCAMVAASYEPSFF